MKSLPVLCGVIIFIRLSLPSCAQNNIDSIYGLDPLLHNGRNYSFSLSYETVGHPFIHTKNYEPGYIVIRDEKFENILLNYDIYNQEVILKYQDIHGANNLIKLSKAWLRMFYLRNNEFVLMKTEDGQQGFFKVIGSESLKVLYSWQKKMSLSNVAGKSNYQFSEPVKTMYLFKNEEFFRFRNNKSFLAYFDPGKRDSIKKYLTENGINVKRVSDENMLNLITFCSHIEN